jgi:hypothetical protein
MTSPQPPLFEPAAVLSLVRRIAAAVAAATSGALAPRADKSLVLVDDEADALWGALWTAAADPDVAAVLAAPGDPSAVAVVVGAAVSSLDCGDARGAELATGVLANTLCALASEASPAVTPMGLREEDRDGIVAVVLRGILEGRNPDALAQSFRLMRAAMCSRLVSDAMSAALTVDAGAVVQRATAMLCIVPEEPLHRELWCAVAAWIRSGAARVRSDAELLAGLVGLAARDLRIASLVEDGEGVNSEAAETVPLTDELRDSVCDFLASLVEPGVDVSCGPDGRPNDGTESLSAVYNAAHVLLAAVQTTTASWNRSRQEDDGSSSNAQEAPPEN